MPMPSARSRSRMYLPQSAELRAAHRALELGALDDLPEEGVGAQQDVVVEEDVVDAHDAVLAQDGIACRWITTVHGQPKAEVRVVVEVRARRDDPVDEARLDERDDRRHAQPRRRERAGEGEADRDVVVQHLLGEELAGLPEPRRVVGEEGSVDQVGGGLAAVDAAWRDAAALEPLRSLVRRVRRARALAMLGRALLLALRARGGRLALAVAVARGLEASAGPRGFLLTGLLTRHWSRLD